MHGGGVLSAAVTRFSEHGKGSMELERQAIHWCHVLYPGALDSRIPIVVFFSYSYGT